MKSKNSVYLKSISCKGIKSPIPFQKPCIYATVTLSGTSQRFKTPVDTVNGEDPEWNLPMQFDVARGSDDDDVFLQIELKDQITLLPDVIVGKAHVAVSDLMCGGSSSRVSYQVKGTDGKANGTIHLWNQIEGFEIDREAEPEAYFTPGLAAPPPSTNYSYQSPVEHRPVYSAPLPSSFHNAYTSQLANPVRPGQIYGAPSPVNSVYPPPDPATVPPYHPPQNNGIYPLPDSGFGSTTSYYPRPESLYPHVEQAGEQMYYPQPETHYHYPPAMGNERECMSLSREIPGPYETYPSSNGFYPPPPRYPYY